MQQGTGIPAAVDEPLALSAGMARHWAATCCAMHADGHRCDCYHGLWQTLRLLGLGPTLGGHAGVYVQAMQDVAAQWTELQNAARRRVLISGCADYSMLAHVLHAFAAQGMAPLVTVLDICPTPLKLNTWYAERVGRPVEVVCQDLLEHDPAQRYDLIVTSSLLGYFSPADRTRLFGAYARMMQPGARLIFSNRLRAGREADTVGFAPADADNFARTVAELRGQLPATAALDKELASRMAHAYASLRRPYPVNSVDTIRGLATAAGLEVLRAQPLQPAAQATAIRGPTLGDGSTYVFAMLGKPLATSGARAAASSAPPGPS